MFHLVTFNMNPDRSGFTVCMCVFHSHIFTVIKYSCFIYIVSDWPISYKYEEYLTVHSNSFQLRVWRLSPRLSGRGVAQSLCATCHGLCRICTEYLGNWDSMLQWALAPEKDDACPLKKRADIVDGETYVCSNCWNVRQWPFLCLNNRELSQVYVLRKYTMKKATPQIKYSMMSCCHAPAVSATMSPFMWSVQLCLLYSVTSAWSVSSTSDVIKSRHLEDAI